MTLTEKSTNTIVEYQQQHSFLLNKYKIIGVEIQTRDIHNPQEERNTTAWENACLNVIHTLHATVCRKAHSLQ